MGRKMRSDTKSGDSVEVDKVLDPDTLRTKLLLASLYLSAYEILKAARM